MQGFSALAGDSGRLFGTIIVSAAFGSRGQACPQTGELAASLAILGRLSGQTGNLDM